MRFGDIRQAYIYERKLPENYSELGKTRFDSIRDCKVSAAFFEQVNQVLICQYYIFSRHRLLEDFCLPIQLRGKQNVVKQWLKAQIFPKTQMDEAIWVIDLWSKNYFHWILECLPRILALKNAGINLPLLLPAHVWKMSYVRESLEDLEVKTIIFNFRQTLKIRKLILPSHDSPCAFDKDYMESVTTTYLAIDQPKLEIPTRKIYISRKDAGKRKVQNEDELNFILSEFGFECVQMEKLSFKEQRELMRETDVLLSIHGAGLANMIFMQEGSKVVELHPDVDRYNSCFYHLASAVGMKYYYSFEIGDHPNPQEANIKVDLLKIRELLNRL